MRIALSANTQSGGGLDPEPLADAMREAGAEVEIFGCEAEELERAAATSPDRIAVAGGDGTIGPAAELAQHGTWACAAGWPSGLVQSAAHK